MLQDEGTIHN